jgi:hypothetical protein
LGAGSGDSSSLESLLAAGCAVGCDSSSSDSSEESSDPELCDTSIAGGGRAGVGTTAGATAAAAGLVLRGALGFFSFFVWGRFQTEEEDKNVKVRTARAISAAVLAAWISSGVRLSYAFFSSEYCCVRTLFSWLYF